jgi:predicted Fe-Mo cluster-binding NifX family protein
LKIAVAATGSDLAARVAPKLGECAYLLIVDGETLAVEAIEAPGGAGGRGGGARVAAEAIARQVQVLLAGYVSPMMAARLEQHGIEVVTGASGAVRQAVAACAGERPPAEAAGRNAGGRTAEPGLSLATAVTRAARQLAAILPMMLGVVLCIGLLKTFLSKEALAWVFRGRPALDALGGALLGSIFAGHPVNSYLIARALRDQGVSLFAATALIVTWVNVGLVQLPAEAAALGGRFALVRFAVSFAVSLAIAMLTALLVGCLT